MTQILTAGNSSTEKKLIRSIFVLPVSVITQILSINVFLIRIFLISENIFKQSLDFKMLFSNKRKEGWEKKKEIKRIRRKINLFQNITGTKKQC